MSTKATSSADVEDNTALYAEGDRMETLKYKGKLRCYLQAPMYMIIVFIAGNIGLYFYQVKLGMITSAFVLLYAIAVSVFYRMNIAKLNEEIVDFATHYGTVQKELLDKFKIPYALLDTGGKLLWMNEEFAAVSEKDKHYQKSISTVFKEITKESLAKVQEDSFCVRVERGNRIYQASMQKLYFSDLGKESEIVTSVDEANTLIALLLFDETELEQSRRENTEQKMVNALVYIDNYDEVFDTVEDVKQSLLTAVIDRKINKYFRDTDALVRKIEKDKYFIVFQQKYLGRLEENRFSILEDIKNTKVGNDMPITLSIGIGVSGNCYNQNAEYARAAIDIALGRGGSQAVIKDNNNVSYYGSRGKEVEKSTRVKARVKAQALREMMESRENVIIMGHSIGDADSFGAAIGVYCAARELGKTAQIVLNTVTSSLRPLIERFETEEYPEDMFIDSEEALAFCSARTLVMVVDTNRPSYTDCPELLKKSRSIVVFDHHRQGNEVIENPILSYIEPYASSTCEMVAEVLQYFSEKVHLKPQEADSIYTGILIDTNNFMRKTGVRTFEAAAYLRRCGAEVTRVRKLLREDMSAYKARAEVVRHAQVYRGAFAVSVCEAGQLESPTVVGAQAANELLNIVGIKAAFVLTEFQNKVYISSRSIDEIDVQLIMERLGGGGHLNVAGAQIENSSVMEVKKRLQEIIDILIEEGEIEL